MSAMIENLAKNEVRGVTRFLWAKNHSAAEIHHHKLCAVYELKAAYSLTNIVFANMFRKCIFPRTSGEPMENDKPTALAVT